MAWAKVKLDPADKYFSQYVRLKDKKCLRCGSPVKLNAKGLPVSHQASHFQGRRKESTRFSLDNVCCLCGGCHMYFTAHPAEHYEWQVKRLGQAKVDEIVLASNMHQKKQRKEEAMFWRQALKQDFGV